MDAIRRFMRISQREKIRKKENKQGMGIKDSIMDNIKRKQL